MPKHDKKRITLTTRGSGFMDVGKTLGKAVAPVLVDLASQEAKKKIAGSGAGVFQPLVSAFGGALPQQQFVDVLGAMKGGMGIPVMMSSAQVRKLKRGGAIQIKPEMIKETAQTAIMALPATAKKIMNAIGKNKGVRYVMKQGEDLIDRMTGGSILGSVFKAVAPAVIDLASEEAKRRAGGALMGNSMVLDALKNTAKTAIKAGVPRLIDMASAEAKKKVEGMGIRSRKKSVMSVGGVPKVSKGGDGLMSSAFKVLAPVAVDLATQEAKRQIGSGIYPAGYSREGRGMPVQLGSPYQSVGSPAMRPFVPMRNQLNGYNPIKQGSGVMETVGEVLDLVSPI